MDRVAIIGTFVSQLTSGRAKSRPQFYETSFISARGALENAGLNRGDIDVFVESSCDLFDGRLISNMFTTGASGAYLKDESRVAEDGTLALAYAYMKIKSGEFDTALVSSSSSVDVDHVAASTTIFDPFVYRPLAMNYLSGLALQSSCYRSRYGVKEEDAARVVERNRGYGKKNPRAYLRSSVSAREVLKSKYVVWPLREPMVPPVAIGGVAVILASEHEARRYTDTPVWIDAISWSTDGYYIGRKPLHRLDPLRNAATKAYGRLEIDRPADQIDIFEVCDITPYHELMACEALSLAPAGKGWKAIADEAVRLNLSGGTLSTNLFLASGMFRIAEAYLQLVGAAGPTQVGGAENALVHGFTYVGGSSSQTHSLVILSR